MDEALNKAFRDYYSDFLTYDEMSEVIAGDDIWLHAEDVRERWQNVLSSR